MLLQQAPDFKVTPQTSDTTPPFLVWYAGRCGAMFLFLIKPTCTFTSLKHFTEISKVNS